MVKGYSIIVATDEVGGIGKGNSICWKDQEDMSFFRETTTKTIDSEKINAVIMGRKTWESLSKKPLKNRLHP